MLGVKLNLVQVGCIVPCARTLRALYVRYAAPPALGLSRGIGSTHAVDMQHHHPIPHPNHMGDIHPAPPGKSLSFSRAADDES